MYSDYLALLIFFLFSLLVPASMILTSAMLRRRTRTNPVGRNSYESAERSFGSRISIMNEYIHYFSMFIAFEMVIAIILLWTFAAPAMSISSSVVILSLLAVAFVFELFIVLLIRGEK